MKIVQKLNKLLNRRQKVQITGLLVLIFVGGLMETVGVTMILPLLNAITDPDTFSQNEYVQYFMDFFHMTELSQFIVLLIILVMAVFIFKNVYLLLQYYLQGRFININRCRMSGNLLALYLNRPYEFFLYTDTPTILRTIYGDMDNVFNLLFQCMNLATEIIVAICISIVIVIIDPLMTLMIVSLMLLATIFVSKVVKKKLKVIGNEAREEQANLYKWIMQSSNGIKDVKVLGKEQFFTGQYNDSAWKYAGYQTWNSVLANTPRLLIETVAIIGILLYIAISILNGNDARNMIGLIGAFGVAALRLLPSVNRINTYIANISYYEPALDFIDETVEMHELQNIVEVLEQKEREKKEQALTMSDKIELKDITYAYPNTVKKIFDHTSMEIPVGKSVGIVGNSGAGKTTIVDILLGLLKLEDGTIECDGTDIFKNMSAWLANIGYIPQNIFMLDDSIRRNVAFGVPDKLIDDERIWAVLEEAQLKEYVEQLDEGLDSEIGERGVRISGGQRQRLGIARALYHNPELLVFDEATSALDNDTETAIMEAVEKLHGRKTMVIIAHRLRTIENCDIIYEVKDGKLIKQSER